MTSRYYDALRESGDDARRVGWRHAAEQAYRFEVALDVIRATRGRVVDVGAGLGALGRVLQSLHPDRPWVGVEREPSFVAAAPDDLIVADYRDLTPDDLPADSGCLVAIGALSGTEPRSGLEALLSLSRARRLPFVLTVLDRDALREHHPGYACDSSLGAVSHETIRRVMDLPEPWNTRVEGITSTDRALFGWLDDAPRFRTNRQRFSAALEGPLGPFDDERSAWLAAEVGLLDTALEILDRLDAPGPLAELTRARVQASIHQTSPRELP